MSNRLINVLAVLNVLLWVTILTAVGGFAFAHDLGGAPFFAALAVFTPAMFAAGWYLDQA